MVKCDKGLSRQPGQFPSAIFYSELSSSRGTA